MRCESEELSKAGHESQKVRVVRRLESTRGFKRNVSAKHHVVLHLRILA